MAVISTPLSSQVVVKYQAGATATGTPIIKQKTLNYVKASATDEDVYQVATALLSLTKHPVIQTILRKNFDLTDM
jgi:hypothetical protein